MGSGTFPHGKENDVQVLWHQMGTSWGNESIFIVTIIAGSLSSLSGLFGVQRVWGRVDIDG